MRFETPITLTGPPRSPAQLLGAQEYDGHRSVHDEDTALALGLSASAIEGPTHFSQFDPLAVMAWGTEWFERGCISAHFKNIVVPGEQVTATMGVTGKSARIEAAISDGRQVLVGSASVGPDHPSSALDERLAGLGDPGELFIIDRVEVGSHSRDTDVVVVTRGETNGPLYPFSLDEKLDHITEPHPWYTERGGVSSPWGRAILPIEMISVLAMKAGHDVPVRRPRVGLFLDLEIRLLAGPVFVGQPYELTWEVVGLSQSRRTESYWLRTSLRDPESGEQVASVLLHSGVFKESYPGYGTRA